MVGHRFQCHLDIFEHREAQRCSGEDPYSGQIAPQAVEKTSLSTRQARHPHTWPWTEWF